MPPHQNTSTFDSHFNGSHLSASDVTALGWTATASVGEPGCFIVRTASGERVGTLLASTAHHAIADLAAHMARNDDARVGEALLQRARAHAAPATQA